MNLQERDLLTQFLEQLVQVRGIPKDPEAEAMIRQAVAQQPDAAYLLVHKALMQQQALANAQAQIAQLQSRLQAPASGGQGSFLGGGFGGGNTFTGNPAPANPGYGYQAPPQPAPQPVMQQPAQPAPAQPSRWSGFMGTAAATAAGVVGGQFLFQGLENMVGHHNQGGMGGGFGGNAPQEVIVNNYYGDSADGGNYDDSNYVDDSSDYAGDGGDDSTWT